MFYFGDGGPAGHFGDAVDVEEARAVARVAAGAHGRQRRERLAAEQQDAQRRRSPAQHQLGALGRRPAQEQRRRRLHKGDSVLVDGAGQRQRSGFETRVDQNEAGAGGQRQEDVHHAGIEAERRRHQDALAGAHLEPIPAQKKQHTNNF